MLLLEPSVYVQYNKANRFKKQSVTTKRGDDVEIVGVVILQHGGNMAGRGGEQENKTSIRGGARGQR